MIAPLRKRHQRMWLVLAILIPAGFIYAAVNTPTAEIAPGPGIPESGMVSEGGIFATVIRSANLELSVLRAPRSAYSELYLVTGSGCDNSLFLGTLQGRGNYQFEIPVNTTICEVRVMDALNNKVVDKLLMQ